MAETCGSFGGRVFLGGDVGALADRTRSAVRGTGVPIVEIPCSYHPFEIDISRARALLGYAPQNDIFRMVDRALEFRGGQ